jgi:hypothetical protein
MNDKRNPFGMQGYFENPPEVIAKDERPKEPVPPRQLSMRARDLSFAFDLLCVLNAHKIAERQGMTIPDRFRKGLSPEKVVSVLGFITDIELDLFSRHDFYNANVSQRIRMLAQFNGAIDDTSIEVRPLVETFLPEEFSEDAKRRVLSLHMRIFAAVAKGLIGREDVLADPDDPVPPAGRHPF